MMDRTPDPDAQAIMSILLGSPIADTTEGLLSAAIAYGAVKRNGPAELRRAADVLESQECTGVAASWCPVHGTCACPDRAEEMVDESCPLHSSASSHAAASLAEIFEPVVAAGSGGEEGP